MESKQAEFMREQETERQRIEEARQKLEREKM
jgi:hypothetical protein